MTSHYRFLRVKNGVCSFANVTVNLAAEGESVEVIDALPATPNINGGEVNRRICGSWVQAAEDGIHDAVTHAQDAGILAGGCRVELIKLLGTDVDTREDAVRCAAALATWKALGGPALDPVFDGHQWYIPYPTRLQATIPGTSP